MYDKFTSNQYTATALPINKERLTPYIGKNIYMYMKLQKYFICANILIF